jgi:hypothetical protein
MTQTDSTPRPAFTVSVKADDPADRDFARSVIREALAAHGFITHAWGSTPKPGRHLHAVPDLDQPSAPVEYASVDEPLFESEAQ